MIIEWTHRLLVLFLIFVFPIWDSYEARRLRAAPTAAVFTGLFFAVSSLWLAMLFHTLFDLRVLALVPQTSDRLDGR